MQSRPARRRIWLASLAVVVIAILVFSVVVVNRRDREPVSQTFWVSGSRTRLTLELACPPVLVTEFYFVPGTGD